MIVSDSTSAVNKSSKFDLGEDVVTSKSTSPTPSGVFDFADWFKSTGLRISESATRSAVFGGNETPVNDCHSGNQDQWLDGNVNCVHDDLIPYSGSIHRGLALSDCASLSGQNQSELDLMVYQSGVEDKSPYCFPDIAGKTLTDIDVQSTSTAADVAVPDSTNAGHLPLPPKPNLLSTPCHQQKNTSGILEIPMLIDVVPDDTSLDITFDASPNDIGFDLPSHLMVKSLQHELVPRAHSNSIDDTEHESLWSPFQRSPSFGAVPVNMESKFLPPGTDSSEPGEENDDEVMFVIPANFSLPVSRGLRLVTSGSTVEEYLPVSLKHCPVFASTPTPQSNTTAVNIHLLPSTPYPDDISERDTTPDELWKRAKDIRRSKERTIDHNDFGALNDMDFGLFFSSEFVLRCSAVHGNKNMLQLGTYPLAGLYNGDHSHAAGKSSNSVSDPLYQIDKFAPTIDSVNSMPVNDFPRPSIPHLYLIDVSSPEVNPDPEDQTGAAVTDSADDWARSLDTAFGLNLDLGEEFQPFIDENMGHATGPSVTAVSSPISDEGNEKLPTVPSNPKSGNTGSAIFRKVSVLFKSQSGIDSLLSVRFREAEPTALDKNSHSASETPLSHPSTATLSPVGTVTARLFTRVPEGSNPILGESHFQEKYLTSLAPLEDDKEVSEVTLDVEQGQDWVLNNRFVGSPDLVPKRRRSIRRIFFPSSARPVENSNQGRSSTSVTVTKASKFTLYDKNGHLYDSKRSLETKSDKGSTRLISLWKSKSLSKRQVSTSSKDLNLESGKSLDGPVALYMLEHDLSLPHNLVSNGAELALRMLQPPSDNTSFDAADDANDPSFRPRTSDSDATMNSLLNEKLSVTIRSVSEHVLTPAPFPTMAISDDPAISNNAKRHRFRLMRSRTMVIGRPQTIRFALAPEFITEPVLKPPSAGSPDDVTLPHTTHNDHEPHRSILKRSSTTNGHGGIQKSRSIFRHLFRT